METPLSFESGGAGSAAHPWAAVRPPLACRSSCAGSVPGAWSPSPAQTQSHLVIDATDRIIDNRGGRHPCSANSAAIRTRRPQKAKRSRRSGRLWAKATPAEIAASGPRRITSTGFRLGPVNRPPSLPPNRPAPSLNDRGRGPRRCWVCLSANHPPGLTRERQHWPSGLAMGQLRPKPRSEPIG